MTDKDYTELTDEDMEQVSGGMKIEYDEHGNPVLDPNKMQDILREIFKVKRPQD